MYKFELSEQFLSTSEKVIFSDFLEQSGLDHHIWEIFECLFESSVSGNIPLVLKVYDGGQLCGAAVIVKCSRYGRALFKNRMLAGFGNSIGLPFYLWIKFGCCMDMMSNPGFVRDPQKSEEIHAQMAEFLSRNTLLTIIYDFDENSHLYPQASVLPTLPHALIDTSGLDSISDYLQNHKNIKKKRRVFNNKGGSFELINRKLTEKDIEGLKDCFVATSEQSIFYLPYQDLYLKSAVHTSETDLEEVYYFVARLNGEFLGYQAAIKTGHFLNALHGAFDRRRKSTFHAYDILFVEMTEFALQNGLNLIDYGAVLNVTKQRMVNQTRAMSYYILSKYDLYQQLMTKMLAYTEIQSESQLKFRMY